MTPRFPRRPEVSPFANVRWVALGLLGAVSACGPSEEPPGPRTLEHDAPLADAQIVLGFESRDAWLATDRASAVSDLHIQGQGALAVSVSERTELRSAPFRFDKTPNTVAFSLRLPDGAEPGAGGRVQAFIECAGRGVFNEPVGSRELSTLTAGEFANLEFGVPGSLRTALAGGCERLVLGLTLEPGGAPGTYVFDAMNLRAKTPPIATDTTPLCGLPSIHTLVQNAVETPEGHWDYQSWLADPALQEELGGLETALAPHPEMVLGPVPDHLNQQIVVVVDARELSSGRVRQALESAEIALPLRIQPSCNPVADLRSALEVAETLPWPEGTPSHAGHLDTALGALVVTFDVGTPPTARELDYLGRARQGLERIPPANLWAPSEASLAAGRALKQRLGSLAHVRYGRPGARSRLNDGEPHFGGAGIGVIFNSCTSGFVVNKTVGGVVETGAVTAGHCFPTTGTFITSGNTKFYGRTVGTPVAAFDMIYIEPFGQRFSPILHTGPSSPTTRQQISKRNARLLDLVCVSGMVTGARCGVEVIDRVCFVRSPPFTQDTTRLTRGVRQGVLIGEPGDSGAPVYTRSGTNLAIINGMEVGGAVDDEICFNDVSTIESRLGVTVAF